MPSIIISPHVVANILALYPLRPGYSHYPDPALVVVADYVSVRFRIPSVDLFTRRLEDGSIEVSR